MLTLNMLYPYPGTPFRTKLEREGRLLIDENEWDNFTYNRLMFIPKNMTREELEEGFKWATSELASAKECAKRVARAIEFDYAPDYIYKQLILRILKAGISLEAMPPWVSENGFSSFQAVW